MSQELSITTTNRVILEDNTQYFYTINPFELTNPLGNVVAVLREFIFIKNGENGEKFCYKLYKTKEGNWYDVPGKNPFSANDILRNLKSAIDE
jgi:hypothetical protein